MQTVVVGASGYSGGQLLKLIKNHPHMELKAAVANSKAGSFIQNEHKFLNNYQDERFKAFEDVKFNDEDLVFLALPQGESARLVSKIPNACKIIDLGADFRLTDSQTWKKYYVTDHAGTWTYGLPELKGQREKIRSSQRIANPGCYATLITLSLAPFIEAEIMDLKMITITAASGTTGAGKKSNDNLLASEIMGNLSNYKLGGTHQHIPEIEQTLTSIKKSEVKINFNPMLAPMPRGILANSNFVLNSSKSISQLQDIFRSYYKNEQFVKLSILDNISTIQTLDNNLSIFKLFLDERTNVVTISATLDNLIKGAAGQAIQNANIINNWPEETGLL